MDGQLESRRYLSKRVPVPDKTRPRGGLPDIEEAGDKSVLGVIFFIFFNPLLFSCRFSRKTFWISFKEK